MPTRIQFLRGTEDQIRADEGARGDRWQPWCLAVDTCRLFRWATDRSRWELYDYRGGNIPITHRLPGSSRIEEVKILRSPTLALLEDYTLAAGQLAYCEEVDWVFCGTGDGKNCRLWGEANERVEIEPPSLMKELYKVVCRQTNCSGRGFDENDCGKCAFCADTADDVIGTYFKLKAQKAWSSGL